MSLRVGQPVTAAQTLGTFGDIHRGTPGVVVGVSYLGAYDVRFIGGRVVRGLRREQLTTRAPRWAGAGSGCLLWLAAVALLAAAVALPLARFRLRRRAGRDSGQAALGGPPGQLVPRGQL